MAIVKILVDDVEKDFVTCLEDEEIEFNEQEYILEDTIELKNMVSDINEKNEGSELNG